MTAVYFTLGVLFFVVAVAVSIGLHELGHMIPARKFGGKVTQYFIGFGPTVWSKQVGETEYGLKAIPLGGYVKIVGMLPPAAKELADSVEVDEDGNEVLRVRKSNTGVFTQLISDARAAEWELVRPEDHDRLFYKLPWWKKVIVMAGGPTVNVLIAFFCYWALFATFGNVESVEREPVVETVAPCVKPADENGLACTDAELRDDPTPAYTAGLQEGDRFVSWNGTEITTWEQLQEHIRENDNAVAVIGVERDGELIQVTARTQVEPRPTVDEDPTKLEPVGFLGVVPVSHEVRVTGGPVYTVVQMGDMVVRVTEGLASLPAAVFDVGQALLGLEERDANGPVSIVGGGRFAGEAAASDALDAQDTVIVLISLVAGFNLFIGLFNFVPLLPLDGGHIAGALWEGIRRGVARLRRRPDPGYVDVAKLLPIAYVMFFVFLVMGVVLIVADLFIPIHLSF